MNVENQTVEQQEKICMTDGDDSNELQPSCMRAPISATSVGELKIDIEMKLNSGWCDSEQLAEHLYELGYRK